MRVITVVGIGADGWSGLAEPSRRALLDADVLFGSRRQLDLVPLPTGQRVTWPNPLLPALPGLLDAYAGQQICVLASGDPMLYGIGGTLARILGPEHLRVLPHPSAVSLACARMGWAREESAVVSLVGRPLTSLADALHPGARLLILSSSGDSPAEVAVFLVRRGYAASRLTVLEQLGGPGERRYSGTAESWTHPAAAPLNVVAVECVGGPVLPCTPGLPDESYNHDGQLTKQEIRAVTLARLAPAPGQLLWDIGAGSGSIGIEWLRSHPSCQAIAVEYRADRLARVAANAESLGVPRLSIVAGRAPGALVDLAAPDTVFIGGGLTGLGVVESCWVALKSGGRLVANAVTVEGEAVLAGWYAKLGGELVRLSVARAAPVGSFTGWRAAMPVTQWVVGKA